MNEKIMTAGSTQIVHSDRLFFLLGGKAQLGKKLLCEGDFIYFSSGNNISSADNCHTSKTVEVIETLSLFEIEMKIVRRKPKSFWAFNENFMSDNVNKNKHQWVWFIIIN